MTLIRYVSQSLAFRPPAEPAPPPPWWRGDRTGHIPGGTMVNPSVMASWWRSFHDDSDSFIVQLVSDDCIGSTKVWRTPTRLEAKIKADSLDAAAARRFAAALTEAADLIDAC